MIDIKQWWLSPLFMVAVPIISKQWWLSPLFRGCPHYFPLFQQVCRFGGDMKTSSDSDIFERLRFFKIRSYTSKYGHVPLSPLYSSHSGFRQIDIFNSVFHGVHYSI